MKATAILLFSLFAVLAPLGLSTPLLPKAHSFLDPCLDTRRPYATSVGSLHGMWNGSCSRLAAAVTSGANRFRCLKKADTYPFFLVFNGTDVGFVVNGTRVPIGVSRIVNTQIIETDSMLALLNISNVRRGGFDLGVSRMTVSCRGGRPVYEEHDVHTLEHGADPGTFPVPLKRDGKLWCNDKNVTVNEHPPGHYNIVCTAMRAGDLGPTWP